MAARVSERKPVILASASMHLVVGRDAIVAENIRTVRMARKILFTTGSRSRDKIYLREIEKKLKENPKLIHYRVLMGPPRNDFVKGHVRRLLNLRDPADRSEGYRTIFVGVFENDAQQPEVFLCGNERRCLALLPPMTGLGDYSTAIVFTGRDFVESYLRLTRELYQAGRKLDTLAAVDTLDVRAAPGPVG
jgi:hypothetical protein